MIRIHSGSYTPAYFFYTVFVKFFFDFLKTAPQKKLFKKK